MNQVPVYIILFLQNSMSWGVDGGVPLREATLGKSLISSSILKIRHKVHCSEKNSDGVWSVQYVRITWRKLKQVPFLQYGANPDRVCFVCSRNYTFGGEESNKPFFMI
jgi:hypothetical protein